MCSDLVVMGLQAITSIHNVLMGKIYLEHKGSWVVSNPGGPFSAKIRFVPTGMLAAKRSYEVGTCGYLNSSYVAMKRIWIPDDREG
jgi:hypothetical protein